MTSTFERASAEPPADAPQPHWSEALQDDIYYASDIDPYIDRLRAAQSPPAAPVLSFGQVVTDGQIVAVYAGEEGAEFKLLRHNIWGVLFEVRREWKMRPTFRPATYDEMRAACPHDWLDAKFCDACRAAQPPASEPESGHWYCGEDIDALVRELDIWINGETGAAKQAKLCDIVAQVRRTPPPVSEQWISVDERLPEFTEFNPKSYGPILVNENRVLAATAEGRVFETICTSLGFSNLNSRTDRVTHWMPLPSHPTKCEVPK